MPLKAYNSSYLKTMNISNLMTDEAILEELGRRIARQRLNSQLTQAVLAEQAGISKSTVERIEAGTTTQMSSMIRVLRVLGLVSQLNALIPELAASPMDMLRHKGKQRQRASTKQAKSDSDDWQWGDQ